MSGTPPPKRDSTGEIFRVRQRGGKNERKQEERAERVEEGSFVPKVWWSESSGRALSSGSGLPVVEDKKRKTPPPESPEDPPDSPQRTSAEVSAAAEGGSGSHSAASSGSGSRGVGSGSSFGSSVVPRTPCDPKAGSKQSARPEAETQKPRRNTTLDSSYRVIFDYHGVLDDHEDNFTQTSRKFIRELLNTSVFVEVLILSYIGVHGPHSQTRRENLQRFRVSAFSGRAGSRFGVHIVPSKRLKAIVCRDTLPVLFCDDQKPLVDSCRPHCKLAEQIGPQNSLEQAVAKAEALRLPPSVTPRAWRELIQAPIV